MDVKTTDDRIVVTSPKVKTTYTISRYLGFWVIKVDTGKMPEDLQGRFTSSKLALTCLQKYLNSITESNSVRREYFKERRRERKEEDGAKSKPEDSQ
jgi:hypothetical protein